MSLVTSEKALAALVPGQPSVLGLSFLTRRSINHQGYITNPGLRDAIKMVPLKE